MKTKKLAGFALLLSVVMLGAFISGCIDQGNSTGTNTTPKETTTTTPTNPTTTTTTPKETTTTTPKETTTNAPTETNLQPDWGADEEKLDGLIELYDKEIAGAKEKLEKLGLELKSLEIRNWEKSAQVLSEMAANESDVEKRVYILQNLAELKYYEALNMRSLVGVGAVETSYWENASNGEPITDFYNMRGEFFYVSNGEISKLGREAMVEKMMAVKGYQIEGLEIYHVGTGSALVAIREGGRTVGAGQVYPSIKLHAKSGMKIKAPAGGFGVLKMVDPSTGETVMQVAPDESGVYTVPPINTTLLGIADDGFCYRLLPPDNNYLDLLDVQDEPLDIDQAICNLNAQIAPFVFEPTDSDTGPYDPTPMEDLYLMPGQYTITALSMKADLKQLAEQLVNLNMAVGSTHFEAKDAKRALDAFQSAITDSSLKASMQTPSELCSCTISPLLDGIFMDKFGEKPFGELPDARVVNITFGNGPFIPLPVEKAKEAGSEVIVYAITDTKGRTTVILGDPGVKDAELGEVEPRFASMAPSTRRLAADYLDRVFLEVYTGRNPQTGKELKVIAFKVLNTDGTVGLRATAFIEDGQLGVVSLPISETSSFNTIPTPLPPQYDWEADEAELSALIDTYDKEIADAKEKLEKLDFGLESPEISGWEESAAVMLKAVEKEDDAKARVAILQEVAQLKYHEVLNLRALVEVSAVETAYWENATTGEPIEPFYREDGSFFYVSNGEVKKLDRRGMVERMAAVKGYSEGDLEIYHAGTGSALTRIREGGRTVGAGQIGAVKIGVPENGTELTLIGGSKEISLVLIDPETGKEIARIHPDENGTYLIPPIGGFGDVVAETDPLGGGFCYRPLNGPTIAPLQPIPEQEIEFTLDCGQTSAMMPIILQPSNESTIEAASLEESYLRPGEYTITGFAMKADLKQLAEQLVSLTVKGEVTKVSAKTPTKVSELLKGAFENAQRTDTGTKDWEESGNFPPTSPPLRAIFDDKFGEWPFDEIPEARMINITFGNGPFIPVVPVQWDKLGDKDTVITVYAVTDSKGNTMIALDDPGIGGEKGKLNTNRIAVNYLDRTFVEVYTGRNPQNGERVRVIAFKLLGADGIIDIRSTTIITSQAEIDFSTFAAPDAEEVEKIFGP
ncbi:hypothetical protein [Palaeococcus ferrophilus]|uniref:hypothetical protein n=1 Tax=Palaeococcus ferrophilus TaxID=83868 RepID=UPI000696BAF8|nr:hypothetical protein [Palaeococcus ferrophilus]